jgi:hypothetical protein
MRKVLIVVMLVVFVAGVATGVFAKGKTLPSNCYLRLCVCDLEPTGAIKCWWKICCENPDGSITCYVDKTWRCN